jgi:hypothetical protein
MQPAGDRKDGEAYDGWFQRERAAVEASRQRADAALDLFRRATEALPRLDAMLREQEGRARKLQAGLESESKRILTTLANTGAEQAAALAAKCSSLVEDAQRSTAEARLRLNEALDSLLSRLDALEVALAQDRRVMNELNRRLLAQTELIEGLTSRQAALEGGHRASVGRLSEAVKKQAAELARLREDDATIRGTTVNLHSQVTRLTRFVAWYASGWLRRLFSKPPVD